MDTLVDCFDTSPGIHELGRYDDLGQARSAAFRIARRHTGRSKILALANPGSARFPDSLAGQPGVELIESGRPAIFCQALAESVERIAAVLLEPMREQDLVHRRFARRVRGPTSAEGGPPILGEELVGRLPPSSRRYGDI